MSKSNPNPYYFCYSIPLLRYLRSQNLNNIAKGINPSTQRTYWMFLRNTQLDNALTQYSQFNKPTI